METKPNYYTLALAAAGTCAPGQENAFFTHVRDLAVRIEQEAQAMTSFLGDLERARNGGEKNGNKGWGVFKATITGVELRPKIANRAFISYTYTTMESGQEVTQSDEIRTEPTSKPEAHGIYLKAQTLIGNDVLIYKRPDPDFDSAKANAGRGPKEKVGASKTVFHIEDLGPTSRPQVPQHPAQVQAPAQSQLPPVPPVPPAQQAAPAQGGGDVNAAKSALYNRLAQAYASAPAQVLQGAAIAGWAAIGNPQVAPAPEQLEQAFQVALGQVQQAAAAAQQG